MTESRGLFHESSDTFAIAVFIGFVLETVGLYFFETKLNIPPETQDAARVVYHISVVTACLHLSGFLMSRALLHMRGCLFRLCQHH